MNMYDHFAVWKLLLRADLTSGALCRNTVNSHYCKTAGCRGIQSRASGRKAKSPEAGRYKQCRFIWYIHGQPFFVHIHINTLCVYLIVRVKTMDVVQIGHDSSFHNPDHLLSVVQQRFLAPGARCQNGRSKQKLWTLKFRTWNPLHLF
jgi:hypothetical protein